MAKIASFRGHAVFDPSGVKLGTLDDYYKDDTTGRPLWLKIKRRWSGHSFFVTLRGARPSARGVVVAFDEDFVRHAPSFHHKGALSADEDALLERYYGTAT